MDGPNKFLAEPQIKAPKPDIVLSIRISAHPSDLSATISSQWEQESKRE